MRAREPRRKVRFKARMRVDCGWSDVTIRDMSSRGMLLTMEEPPKVGSYVEICGPKTNLIARAVWVRGTHFGVRTQDRIDVEALVSPGRLRPQESCEATPHAAHARPATTHARSRQKGAAIEFGTLLIGILTGAGILALVLYDILARPMQAVTDTLGS